MGRRRLTLNPEERETLRRILGAVSGLMMVPEHLIADNRRAPALVTLARMVFTRVARQRGYTFGKIAMYIGWDHTSVMYQWRVGEAAVTNNDERGQRIAELEHRISTRVDRMDLPSPSPFGVVQVATDCDAIETRKVPWGEVGARFHTRFGYVTRAGEIICTP